MTIKKAIEILKDIEAWFILSEIKEVVKMSIEALETVEKLKENEDDGK